MPFIRVPLDEPNPQTIKKAIQHWRNAAAHEKYCLNHGLSASSYVAGEKVKLYNQIADDLEKELATNYDAGL